MVLLRRIAAHRRVEGRQQVDALDEAVVFGAAGRVGCRIGIVDDHRQAQHAVVEQLLLAQPVVAEIVAVVRGQDDHRVVHPACPFHVLEQLAEMIVDLFDQAHIGRDHRLPHLVAAEALAVLVLLERGVDRVAGLALAFAAHRRDDIAGAVHGVVGRRRQIGPVRLDIGKMQAPVSVVAAFLHEVLRAPRHVGGLGMDFLHPCGQPGVAHFPAVDDVAVAVDRGGAIVLPRVFAFVAQFVEIAVVGEIRRAVAARMQAVVAVEGLEAGLGRQHAMGRGPVDPQPVEAGLVDLHMGLAGQRDPGAQRAQMIAHRADVQRQRHPVPVGAVGDHVAAGIEGHARRAADRRLGKGAGEPDAFGRQRIDMRRLERRMAHAGEVIRPQLVAHDEQDIPDFAHGRKTAGCGCGSAGP